MGFFPLKIYIFQRDLHKGQEADTSRSLGLCSKPLRSYLSLMLWGLPLLLGWCFPAGRAGATQERCRGVAAAFLCCCLQGLPHQAGTTCQALSWARKEPDWGCVPAHCGTWSLLNRITALAVNSSSRAPRLSCRVVL